MSQEEQQSAVPLREQVQRLTFVFDCFPTPAAAAAVTQPAAAAANLCAWGSSFAQLRSVVLCAGDYSTDPRPE